MAERKRRRLTNRMQDGCAYVQSETGKEGVGHYTTQRRLPELITFTCQVEDVMEKYGIESVEELDYLLEVFKKMRKEYGKLNQENYKNKKDRNTWKRACELACKWFKQTGFIGDQTKVDYYYQQAKTEGNDE